MCLLTTQLLIISLPLKVFTLGKEAKKGGIMSKSTFKILFYIRGNHAPFDRWKIQCKMLPKTKEHLTLEFPTKRDTVTAILGCFPNQ